jgi:hypothetical protein
MPGEYRVVTEQVGENAVRATLMHGDTEEYSRMLLLENARSFGPGREGFEKFVACNVEDMQKQAAIKNGTYQWRPIDFFLMTGSNFEGWPAIMFWIGLAGFGISTYLTGDLFLGVVGGIVAAMGFGFVLFALVGIHMTMQRSDPS